MRKQARAVGAVVQEPVHKRKQPRFVELGPEPGESGPRSKHHAEESRCNEGRKQETRREERHGLPITQLAEVAPRQSIVFEPLSIHLELTSVTDLALVGSEHAANPDAQPPAAKREQPEHRDAEPRSQGDSMRRSERAAEIARVDALDESAVECRTDAVLNPPAIDVEH